MISGGMNVNSLKFVSQQKRILARNRKTLKILKEEDFAQDLPRVI